MSAAAVAERLVAIDERSTRSRMLAYHNVARCVGKSSSWLRGLIRDRVTDVNSKVKDKLDALLVRSIEAEIARLEADLALARQSGCHPASQHVGAIEAHLSAARSLLNGG